MPAKGLFLLGPIPRALGGAVGCWPEERDEGALLKDGLMMSGCPECISAFSHFSHKCMDAGFHSVSGVRRSAFFQQCDLHRYLHPSNFCMIESSLPSTCIGCTDAW